MSIKIDMSKCDICCECINVCSSDVLGVRAGNVVAIMDDKCQLCEVCVDVCETEAITVEV